MRCTSTTQSAGLLKSSGRIGQPRWCTLSRGLGAWASRLELPHGHGPSLPKKKECMLGDLCVAGFSLLTVFAVLGRFSPEEEEGREPGKSTVTENESLSLTVDGLQQKGEGSERK